MIGMGKMNRGDTTKLSLKMSIRARQRIERASENLNLSKAGIILFALSNILENVPSKEGMLNLEKKIDLEPENFPITIHMDLHEKITDLAKSVGMKKNVFVGLLVSNYFESMSVVNELLVDRDDTKPRKLMVQVNEDLKKKMDEYSEKHYIALSGLISHAILRGPKMVIPEYGGNETEKFFTTVPEYLSEKVKREADKMMIREHFYVSLCCYRAFMTPDGEFYDD
jgi:hypothetical protein